MRHCGFCNRRNERRVVRPRCRHGEQVSKRCVSHHAVRRLDERFDRTPNVMRFYYAMSSCRGLHGRNAEDGVLCWSMERFSMDSSDIHQRGRRRAYQRHELPNGNPMRICRSKQSVVGHDGSQLGRRVVHSRCGSGASPECNNRASNNHHDGRASNNHDGCSFYHCCSIFQSIFANVDYFAGTSARSSESVAKGINADCCQHINYDW